MNERFTVVFDHILVVAAVTAGLWFLLDGIAGHA